jgi:hypothetical protein
LAEKEQKSPKAMILSVAWRPTFSMAACMGG